ncbi:hypothetical protein NE865_01783 [Phthorimaea operculella]|nr:hypothetical protein NE865_01783 [Phthorimaea operculella]
MAVRRIWVLIALAALVFGADVDENEQKKRGAGKTTTLNAIPTGSQKPEYTYSIYSPSQSNPPSPQYQTQVPNSFYPTQGVSQYYSNPPEASPQYPQQPQINLIPPQSSQFAPLNFVPNPGYQAKYQIVPTKAQNGNIQIALIPQPQTIAPSVVPYNLFSPHSGQIQAQQQPFQGQFNLQNYQLPFGNPYLGHSPTMFLLPQPNPSLYQNLLYQNPSPPQSFYNYYPGKAQAQYTNPTQYTNPSQYNTQYNSPSIPPPSPEYEKLQGPVNQSISKDENDLSVHSTEYISSDAYKNPYSSSRTYSKVQ